MLIATFYSDRLVRSEPVSMYGSKRHSAFLSSIPGGDDDFSNCFRILFAHELYQYILLTNMVLRIPFDTNRYTCSSYNLDIKNNYQNFTFTGVASISTVPCRFTYLTFPTWIIFTHVQVACFKWIHCQIVKEKTIKISMRIDFGKQSIGKCPPEKWTGRFTQFGIMLRL